MEFKFKKFMYVNQLSKRINTTLWWDEAPGWLHAKIRLGLPRVGDARFVFEARPALEAAGEGPLTLALWLASNARGEDGGQLSPEDAAKAFLLPLIHSVSRSTIFRSSSASHRIRTACERRKECCVLTLGGDTLRLACFDERDERECKAAIRKIANSAPWDTDAPIEAAFPRGFCANPNGRKGKR